jgi:hypothetical protein
MDDAEREAFVDAVLMTVGRDKAEEFIEAYYSEEGIVETANDDYTFLFDAIHIWEEARNHFSSSVTHKMTLHLYHGRKTIDEEMHGMGTEGPVLQLDGMTMTYGTNERLLFTGQDDWEFLDHYLIEGGDLFYYDGIYYGDWSVQPLDKDSERVVQKYDPKLAKEGIDETV